MAVVAVPHSQATTCVTRYVGYEEHGRAVRRREVPRAGITLVLSLGPEMRVQSRGHGAPQTLTSFVVGLHRGPSITEHDGLQQGIQVDLTPTGAFSLLGVPMHELADAVVPVDALLGRAAHELGNRLADAHTWPERLAIVDGAVNAAVAAGPPACAEVEWAAHELARRRGRGEVGDLATTVGWSTRHFNARFREQVGATPKLVARLMRFEHAVELLSKPRAADEPLPLTDIALQCGYYDQAHLNNDFREFAGCSPMAFLREEAAASEVTFFQDAEAPAFVASSA
jgi:AraC-like DNA-binding protein